MGSTSKKNDRHARTATGIRDFQLPVPAQKDDAPVVWVDRSLLTQLCGEAVRAGPKGASGYLVGHWVIGRAEAVITTWSTFEPDHGGSVSGGQAPGEPAAPPQITPSRKATFGTEVIGIWSTVPVAKRRPRWPRAAHRRLSSEHGFDPRAAMLQLVLEEGNVWRPRLWLWRKGGRVLPRAVLGPRPANIRLVGELKGD